MAWRYWLSRSIGQIFLRSRLVLSNSSRGYHARPADTTAPPLFVRGSSFPTLVLPPGVRQLTSTTCLTFERQTVVNNIGFHARRALPIANRRGSNRQSRHFHRHHQHTTVRRTGQLVDANVGQRFNFRRVVSRANVRGSRVHRRYIVTNNIRFIRHWVTFPSRTCTPDIRPPSAAVSYEIV